MPADTSARSKVAAQIGLIASPTIVRGIEVVTSTTDGVESQAPSLLIKAYALALKSRLTFDQDLSALKQAIFVASVQNKGIPIDVAKEYTNEQLYQHANSVQEEQSVTLHSAHGDFFEYMSDYVANAEDDSSSLEEQKDDNLKEYHKYRTLAQLEFKHLLADFGEVREHDPSYKWQDHINPPLGDSYLKACDARDAAAAKLSSSGLSLVMRLFDSSHARMVPRTAQNMPCCIGDMNLGEASRLQVDPGSIIYRPAYGLSGFESAAISWRDDYEKAILKPQKIMLDLVAAHNTPWKTLGFSRFDGVDKKLDKTALDSLKDYEISLTFTGMQSFRVTRGLWNIEDFREYLPLKKEASAKFGSSKFRTNVLLLAYGVQIQIKVPHPVGNKTLFPELLSEIKLSPKGAGLWVSDQPSNDAYSVLLAVLAEKC